MDLKEINAVSSSNSDFRHSFKKNDIKISAVAGDSAFAIGHGISVYKEALLPRKIAPRAQKIAAALPRFLGAGATLLTSGVRIMNIFNEDKKNGNYSKTRKEVFATSMGVAGGSAVGTVAGLATAGAAAAGAPAIVLGGIAAIGLTAVGYAAYRVRGWAVDFYDKKIAKS